jgi:hypothetical protein
LWAWRRASPSRCGSTAPTDRHAKALIVSPSCDLGARVEHRNVLS